MTTVDGVIDGHVAVITLAPSGGEHDRAFIDALAAMAAAFGAVDEVRVVVVAGAFGTAWAESLLTDPPAVVRSAGAAAAVDAVAAIPQPVIAAIEGPAHSPGLELALACDVRISDAGATFQVGDTAQGRVPLAGATQRLPRAVGRAAALRLLLLGETIDAAEALRIGLLSQVAEGEPAAAARGLADAIAQRGPIATRMAKEAVHRGSELTLEQALRYELDLTVLLQSTTDRAEGVRAFIERRVPHFTGR